VISKVVLLKTIKNFSQIGYFFTARLGERKKVEQSKGYC